MDSFILKAGVTLLLSGGVTFFSFNSALATLDEASAVQMASIEDSQSSGRNRDGRHSDDDLEDSEGEEDSDDEEDEGADDGDSGDTEGWSVGDGLLEIPEGTFDIETDDGPDLQDYLGETPDIEVQPDTSLDLDLDLDLPDWTF